MPDTYLLQRWQDEAEQRYFTSLETVRGNAQSWLANIATLTGIFGIVGLGFTGDQIAGLLKNFPWMWVVLVLMALSHLTALVFAYQAAHGTPTLIHADGTSLRKHVETSLPKVVADLMHSRFFVALTVGLLFFLAVLNLSTKAATTTPLTYLILNDQGKLFCGQPKSGQGLWTQLILKNNTEIEIGNVKSATPVGRCE